MSPLEAKEFLKSFVAILFSLCYIPMSKKCRYCNYVHLFMVFHHESLSSPFPQQQILESPIFFCSTTSRMYLFLLTSAVLIVHISSLHIRIVKANISVPIMLIWTNETVLSSLRHRIFQTIKFKLTLQLFN